MRLVYADPPYPGKARLYVERREVDHAELVAELERFDGWALSTDERNLAYVLSLCPPSTRVLAWCRPDSAPFPSSPYAAWEPVLMRPARVDGHPERSYHVEPAPPRGFAARGPTLVGSKPAGFCEWLIRCLGAEPDDELVDLFPGTGIMGETWDRWRRQGRLFALPPSGESFGGAMNRIRRSHPQLPGMPAPRVHPERLTST